MIDAGEIDLNWDAIGAISEILAAIAVVVTLIYLAKQIRQNSQAVEISALRDATEQWNRWSEVLATSPQLAEIVSRGNKSYRDLPEVEALQYGAYIQMFFDCVESARELALEHQVQKDVEVLETIVARRIGQPGFAEWWSENHMDYSADLTSWINSIGEKQELGE